ncbi:MAG: DUF1573 domain-containing protein [Deltaproteobacteria bacterium]|nr:DUF1573 domain-containing protein [Deltaproteobacteria bacterium]MBW2265501.1 DUF1573 domain-containing protein [Deltaproteobacteria bacterium]MBW2317850.1 DUF1573 domain-containing protein [Deltaproteobacteria bacterium]MBW2602079.1 DUF1573 domain-containing protein [Deltaproteobacteria bacterium]OEU44424.1 MAG: hypothetical protein BBJ60_10470 [Desulfobacterales bacterium S7086C20]
MRAVKTILLALLIGTISAGFSLAKEGSKTTPVVEVEESTYDFKQVSQGEIVKHDFRVFNRGDASLEIKKVKPG